MVKFPTHGKISGFFKTVVTSTHGFIHKNAFVAINVNKWHMMWNDDLINHIQINQSVFIGSLPCST